MKCLFDNFATRKTGDVLWIDGQFGQIDVRRLTQAITSIDPRGWQGKHVAVSALPVLEFVTALVFLDGLAQSIMLLPTEDDPATREARLEQAGVDIVVDSHSFDFAKLFAQFDASNSGGNMQPPCSARPAAIQTTWLLPTSGTTGTPKLIAHTFASLTRSMTRRHVGDNYIWGSLYSLRRFAGLQVFLQSWMCGTPLILNEERADLSDALCRFISLGCNALSATPSMWRKLAMHPLFEKLSLKQITLGGEIVDQSLLDMLTKKFSGVRITHIYASTEAGVGFAVRDGFAGFPANYLLQPPSGVAMHVDERNHLMFRAPMTQSLPSSTETAWIDSGDVVEILGDRVHFLGRANGSINVGGNKVMPEEIESVIKDLPNIAFVQVRARKSAILGNLVEAAVTPTKGNVLDAVFKKQIIAHCRTRLDAFKVPAFIVAADGIKLTATGKVSRENVE